MRYCFHINSLGALKTKYPCNNSHCFTTFNLSSTTIRLRSLLVNNKKFFVWMRGGSLKSVESFRILCKKFSFCGVYFNPQEFYIILRLIPCDAAQFVQIFWNSLHFILWKSLYSSLMILDFLEFLRITLLRPRMPEDAIRQNCLAKKIFLESILREFFKFIEIFSNSLGILLNYFTLQ